MTFVYYVVYGSVTSDSFHLGGLEISLAQQISGIGDIEVIRDYIRDSEGVQEPVVVNFTVLRVEGP